VPGFKTTFSRYLGAVESLSYEFTGLVAEALGLPPDGLAQFYDASERMQHRAKVRCFCVGLGPPPPHPPLLFDQRDRGHKSYYITASAVLHAHTHHS